MEQPVIAVTVRLYPASLSVEPWFLLGWSSPLTTPPPVWIAPNADVEKLAQNVLTLPWTPSSSWYFPEGVGLQEAGAGGLLGMVDGGGGGGVVEVTG